MRSLKKGESGITVITFAHHKGGTGKTTSCLNIAGFLQKSGKTVLVIDCDPQANATSGLGVDPESREQNIYDVFMNVFEGFPDITIDDITIPTSSGIYLAPSSLDLVGVEPYLYYLDDRATVLSEALLAMKQDYDYILIDTPPSMGQFVINGLVAADRTIITLDSGVFALTGVESLKTIFSDIEENFGRQVICELAIISRGGLVEEARSPLDSMIQGIKRFLNSDPLEKKEEERIREHEEEIRSLFSEVYTVPYDARIQEAQQNGLPVSHYAPEIEAARIYRDIANIVAEW